METQAEQMFIEIEKEVVDKIYTFYHNDYKNFMSYYDFLTTDSFFVEKVKLFIKQISRREKEVFIGRVVEKFLVSIEDKILDPDKENVLLETKRNLRNFLQSQNINNGVTMRLQLMNNEKNNTSKLTKLCRVIENIYSSDEQEFHHNKKKYPLHNLVKSVLSQINKEEETNLNKNKMIIETQANIIKSESNIQGNIQNTNQEVPEFEEDLIAIKHQKSTVNNPVIAMTNIPSNNKKVFYPVSNTKICEDKINLSPIIKMDYPSFNQIPIQQGPDGLIENFKRRKSLREIKGDEPAGDIEEHQLFPLLKSQTKSSANQTEYMNTHRRSTISFPGVINNHNEEKAMRRKSSIVFRDIPTEDLRLVRERDLTPIQKRKQHMEEIVEIDLDRTENRRINSFNSEWRKKSRKKKHTHESDCQLTEESQDPERRFLAHHDEKGKYQIHSDETAVIKLPEGFKTNDYDLKLLCDLLNEKKDHGWKDVYIQYNISIFRKSIKGSPTIMIRTYATIDNFTREHVFSAITDVNIRRKWDKIFSEFKTIETNTKEGKEYLYMSIKSPSIFVADRDFVQQRKIWENFPDDQSTIIHFKSVDHPLAPVKPKLVRAHTIISGYYIKTISVNPPKTFLGIISQTDIKGNIPKFIVNTVSQTAPKEWISNLITGCAIAKGEK